MEKKIALILSGGGAKGAFQAGAEKYARENKGYHWDIIAGVSVGALNGVMLAMGKHQRLMEIWNTISNDRVYTGGFNLLSLIKLLFGAKSFYGNDPLYRMLMQELEPEKIGVDLRIGAVSMVTGDYVQYRRDYPRLAEAILASTVMPVIWTPVEIDEQNQSMVDGGVRNISPIGDVLDAEPDEIVVMNCHSGDPGRLPSPPRDVGKIGLRTLDLMLNELFLSDLREFLRINELVLQAKEQGVTLVNPKSGRPYKYYECKVIQPEEPLGDTLDFSQEAVQQSIKIGVRRAREVLGR